MDSGLIRVAHGLRRPSDQVADLQGLAAALLTVCPPGTVLAGVTAARLHGLWLPRSASERIEVIVHPDRGLPHQRSYSKRGELRARRQHLATDEVVDLNGLPVTSAARTWLDLSSAFSGGDLLALGDSALRNGARRDELDGLICRATHRPGVVRARMMAPLLDGRSRSHPESVLRWIVLDAGMPRPAVNVPVFDEFGQWLFEPDLGFDDVKLGLEYNGKHHTEDGRMQKDITRTIDVEDRGQWRVATFGAVEVYRRQDLVARRILTLRNECALLHGLSGPLTG